MTGRAACRAGSCCVLRSNARRTGPVRLQRAEPLRRSLVPPSPLQPMVMDITYDEGDESASETSSMAG